MNELATTETNGQLAAACQACAAACCRKGMIFLPESEFQRIRNWLLAQAPGEIAEFESRCAIHDGFRLYDQKAMCQFLDKENLCRLHTQGVKPSECFWWPFHVYIGNDDVPEIRLSTSCCEGFKVLSDTQPFTNAIKQQARTMGFDLLRGFRRVYGGSYEAKPVCKLPD